MGYSVDSDEKEADERTDYRPADFGNGEEVVGSGTPGHSGQALRRLWSVLHAVNRTCSRQR